MAERQNRRRKKRDEGQADKPTDEETAVGKHLRFNLATKNSNFMGHKVDYFTGSKAVDMLLDSKWASGKSSTDILFTDRNSVVQYLDRLLQKGMFHRALKVVKKSKKDEKKDKEGKKEDKLQDVKKEETKSKKDKKQDKVDKDKVDKEVNDREEGTPKAKKSKEGKRKIKLEPTDDQYFKDGSDAYVWIYDPIKPMYYVYGLLLVVGAIGVCLFPLWPPWMRAGTYYLSLGGAGVVGSVLALAIVRLVMFVLLWGCTIGRFHLWIFPNLLADVGILESFQPAYQLDVNKPDTKSSNTTTLTTEEETKETEEEKGVTSDDVQEEDPDKQNEEEEEEDEEEDDNGSHSSSNPDHQDEFEFIEQDEVSAASEESQPSISRQ
ncbi:translocation protein SEC62-like [Asterias rubens]|uniref:translocation protein SEC62-like n=1 Tax=Asterias rubens TaxID=7604 RepID=UPI001455B769|nr:translocation protein SEC62-like [Asterias rubens]